MSSTLRRSCDGRDKEKSLIESGFCFDEFATGHVSITSAQTLPTRRLPGVHTKAKSAVEKFETDLPVDEFAPRFRGLHVVGFSPSCEGLEWQGNGWVDSSVGGLRSSQEKHRLLAGRNDSSKAVKSVHSCEQVCSVSTYPPPDLRRASTADPAQTQKCYASTVDPAQSYLSRSLSLPMLTSGNLSKPHLQSSPSRRKALVKLLRSQQHSGNSNAGSNASKLCSVGNPQRQHLNRMEQLLGGIPLNAHQESCSVSQKRFTNATRLEHLRKLAAYPPILPAHGSSNPILCWGLDKVLRPLSADKGRPSSQTNACQVIAKDFPEAQEDFHEQKQQTLEDDSAVLSNQRTLDRSCATQRDNCNMARRGELSERNLDWLSSAETVGPTVNSQPFSAVASRADWTTQLLDDSIEDEFEMLRPWTGESNR